MGNATNITYGSFNFQSDAGPVPLLNITKNFKRIDSGQKIGSVFTVTLDGEVNLLPSGVSGYTNVNDMQEDLFNAFSTDCEQFTVTCGGDTLIQQRPRVNSVRFEPSNDNWSQTADYTIELEWDGEDFSGHLLDNISENWDMEFDTTNSYYDWDLDGTGDNNMNLFSLTHTVSAKGVTACSGLPAWKRARAWVTEQLGYDDEDIAGSGVFNLNASNFSGWNHSRVQRVGETDGTFQVTETWLLANTGLDNNAGAAIEDFTANVAFESQNGLTNVSINGNIRGLEEVSYGSSPNSFSIVQNKYDNASGYWENVKPKLPGRASLVADTTINPIATNFNVGHNPTQGTINYNYTYNNRPCNFVTGALVEDITINDNNPTDVFAQLTILGRPHGPILQDLNTVTSNTRTVNINVVMGPTTGCGDIAASINAKPNVSGLLCSLQQDISGANTQLFKNQDQESWNIKTGAYSRTVQWTWTTCSGAAPNTSFCG